MLLKPKIYTNFTFQYSKRRESKGEMKNKIPTNFVVIR